MNFFVFFFLSSALSWAEVTKSFSVSTDSKVPGPELALIQEHEALLKLAQAELGENFSSVFKELKTVSDELYEKTPFDKEKGNEAFYRQFLKRRFSLSFRHPSASQVDVTYDPVSFRKQTTLSSRTSSKVFIVDEFEIQNFSWEDIELTHPDSFFHPIAAQWEKKLRTSLEEKVLDVELCDRACLKFYGDWLEETKGARLPRDFYFLNISFLIRRTYFDPRIRDMSFMWNGRVHGSSFASKQNSRTLEISKETGRWMGLDQKSLNSYLATRIYQSGVVALETAIGLLLQGGERAHSSVLALKGLRTIDEAQRFIERIKKLNKTLGLRGELLALEGERVLFKISYASEEKSFTEFLSSLKDVKLTRSYKIDIVLAKGVYELKFVPN